MENITIGQIVAGISTITAIVAFFGLVYKFIKVTVFDRIEKNTKDIVEIKETLNKQKEDINDSKSERLILLEGLLACLKGLQELNCDGPVSEAINNIEEYLINKSHK